MPLGISTHIFFNERLTPRLLDTLHAAGAEIVEVFASRHHFNFTDRAAVREVANWFRAHPVAATMHMPLFTEAEEAEWSRHTEPTLNLVSRNKADRITAMDEVKRSLEAAEQIPFRSCVLHLGQKDDRWSTETLDLSLTAIEHLKAFATPLGVQLLLENLGNHLSTPAHLVEITRVGHFDTVGFCLDIGHAHLAQPMDPTESDFDRISRERLHDQWGDAGLKDAIPESFQIFASRLAELHLHDNNGLRDEHLWPGRATPGKGVDWGIVRSAISHLDRSVMEIFEVAPNPAYTEKGIREQTSAAKRLFGDMGEG